MFAGDVVHVWARRVDRWPLFVDESDFERYVALLAETVERFEVILLSFCLMPNHVHLLVELREPNLSKAMQSLHGRYVRWFNDRHDRVGRLFEDRFKSKLVEDDLYFVVVARYIETNPVDASLGKRPEDWRWSSRGLIAARGCPPWIADHDLRARRDELKDRDCPRL
jgi:putative transposase